LKWYSHAIHRNLVSENPKMNNTRISSWNELNEMLFQESWKAKLGRYRSNYAFRGLSDSGYELKTSLMRLGGDFAKLEGHLLRNFRKYAHRDVETNDSEWNWLSLAQHHGLPTRLLDWTFSPFVAMHFATANIERFNSDAAIWCVDYVKIHELLPNRLRKILKEEGSNVFTVEMLKRGAETLQVFDNLNSSEFVVFVEPPSLDDRMVNQYALFSFISSPASILNQWLLDHEDLYQKIVIPAELKWEIRDKLDQANITERVLFPELDGLSRWLKRHYSPRE
jgi:hypothetical protein